MRSVGCRASSAGRRRSRDFGHPGWSFDLHDGHPLAWSLVEDRPELVRSYFEEAEPLADDAVGYTYTDAQTAPMANRREYEWNHGIGETLSGSPATGATPRLARRARLDRGPIPLLVEKADDRAHPSWSCLPMSFSLLATRATAWPDRIATTERRSSRSTKYLLSGQIDGYRNVGRTKSACTGIQIRHTYRPSPSAGSVSRWKNGASRRYHSGIAESALPPIGQQACGQRPGNPIMDPPQGFRLRR